MRVTERGGERQTAVNSSEEGSAQIKKWRLSIVLLD